MVVHHITAIAVQQRLTSKAISPVLCRCMRPILVGLSLSYLTFLTHVNNTFHLSEDHWTVRLHELLAVTYIQTIGPRIFTWRYQAVWSNTKLELTNDFQIVCGLLHSLMTIETLSIYSAWPRQAWKALTTFGIYAITILGVNETRPYKICFLQYHVFYVLSCQDLCNTDFVLNCD